jgi:DNA-binding NarL/FixJ family response regulator
MGHPLGRGTAPAAIRIAVQSDDRLRRDALAAYLETLPDFTVVGRVADPDNLIPLCELQRPDLTLLDIGLRHAGTLHILGVLRDRFPSVRTVLAYGRISAEQLTEAHESGVSAVVPHSHGLRGLLAVLRAPAARLERARWNGSGLTARQREILLLVASGHSVNEIAELLDISPGTVENHKRRVYAKLNAGSATQAVAHAASLGIIDSTLPASRPQPPPPEEEPGRVVLSVVVGNQSAALDQVVTTLIAHQLPVIREFCPRAVAQVHWLRWHRGPVIRVLVDPSAEHWRVGATLGRTALMIHSGGIDQSTLTQGLANGVVAVLPAEHIERQLVPVLALAAEGYLVADAASTAPLLDAASTRRSELPAVRPTLTAREHDILRYIGRSHTVRQTARALGIAVKTVENAQGHLFRKLGVHNRAAAVATAYALGLLQPSEARPAASAARAWP